MSGCILDSLEAEDDGMGYTVNKPLGNLMVKTTF